MPGDLVVDDRDPLAPSRGFVNAFALVLPLWFLVFEAWRWL